MDDSLGCSETEACEAHELIHVLLSDSFAGFETGGDEGYVVLEVNNALSHGMVMRMMVEHGLSNDIHIKDADIKLKQDIPRWLADPGCQADTPEQHRIGVILYDDEVNVLPGRGAVIHQLLEGHHEAQKAYELAHQLFDGIQTCPVGEQEKVVKEFMRQLGRYDLGRVRRTNPPVR